jgi:hypothetical protein
MQPKPMEKETAQQLMGALFDTYDADKHQAVAEITNEKNDVDGYFLMTLRATNTLPDGRVVAIVNGTPSDENGNDMSAHPMGGQLNVYVLRRNGDGWTVLERHEGLGDLGSNGQIGDVNWLTLGPGKPGFAVSSGGVWQGYVIANAAIFELDHNVRDLGGFPQMSSNEGACMPGIEDCWTVEGALRFVDQPRPDGYRDILVDFEDKRFTVTENGKGDLVQHIKTTRRQTARYRFNGKQYALVSGVNPVPGI